MEKKISKAVLKRLPGYLAYLKSLQDQARQSEFCTVVTNREGPMVHRHLPVRQARVAFSLHFHSIQL